MLAPRDLSIAVLTTFVWALNVVFTKVALSHVSPLVFNLMRMLVVLPLAVVLPLSPGQWVRMLPTALAWGVGHFAFIGFGIQAGASVGMGGLLLQVSPILATIFAYFILGDRPSRYHLLAFIPICTGIIWGIVTADNFCLCMGYVHLLIAAVFMGLGSVLLKIAISDSRNPINLTAAIVSFAPLTVGVHLILALIFEKPEIVFHQVSLLTQPWMLGVMLFGGWLSMVVGMRAWSGLIRTYSVADVAPFCLLIPCFTMFFGYLMGECLSQDNVIAAVLIFTGLVVGQCGHITERIFIRLFRLNS